MHATSRHCELILNQFNIFTAAHKVKLIKRLRHFGRNTNCAYSSAVVLTAKICHPLNTTLSRFNIQHRRLRMNNQVATGKSLIKSRWRRKRKSKGARGGRHASLSTGDVITTDGLMGTSVVGDTVLEHGCQKGSESGRLGSGGG